jgi:hypothetical protein
MTSSEDGKLVRLVDLWIDFCSVVCYMVLLPHTVLLCMYCVLCSTVSMPRTSERAQMLQRLHALQLRTEQRHKRLKMNARRHQVAPTNDGEDDEDIENDSESESKELDPSRPPINYHTTLLDSLVRLRYWKPRGGDFL